MSTQPLIHDPPTAAQTSSQAPTAGNQPIAGSRARRTPAQSGRNPGTGVTISAAGSGATSIADPASKKLSFSNGQWHEEDILLAERTEWVTETAHHRRGALEILFLPEVKTFKEDPALKLLREKISTTYNVPDFFWSRTGYDANGFFNYKNNPLANFAGTSYGTTCRFLIKEITRIEGNLYEYDWQYLSFISLSFCPKDDPKSSTTHILLCFDLSPKTKTSIIEAFRSSTTSSWSSCPLGIYSVLVPMLAYHFDEALWEFRKPIRDIEKLRNREGDTSPEAKSAPTKTQYTSMHELSRHIIHEVETLDIAAKTLKSISETHKSCKHDTGTDPLQSACSQDLEFYDRFLENLRLRAAAFEKRLDNEIRLAFNLSAAGDTVTLKEILEESRNDGRELAQLVSTVTLLFLPGSFISSFFGMNFFEYGDKKVGTSDQIYIFVVVTLVVTAGAFVIWRAYTKNPSKGGDKTTEAQAVAWNRGKGDTEMALPRANTFPAPTAT